VERDIIAFSNDADHTYRLTAACTIGAVATGNALIEPALVTAVTSAHTVAVKATHVVNLGFDPSAFGLVMRLPAEDVLGGTGGDHFPFIDSLTGAPFMLSHYGVYHASQWEVSALYGMELLDPRKAARLAG
jgi:hypothetical protein